MKRYTKSIENGETIEDRGYNRETVFASMDKEAILNTIIEQTEKELAEKKQSSRLDEEITKIKRIYQEVSEINGY
jgi:hypothetical protein